MDAAQTLRFRPAGAAGRKKHKKETRMSKKHKKETTTTKGTIRDLTENTAGEKLFEKFTALAGVAVPGRQQQ